MIHIVAWSYKNSTVVNEPDTTNIICTS